MECLVTKLKAVVDNTNLYKLNEIKIKVSRVSGTPTETNRKISIVSGESFSAAITGEGYFMDSTLENNLGKVINAYSGLTNLYASNGDYIISIIPKNSIAKIVFPATDGTNAFTLLLDNCDYMTSLLTIDAIGGYISGDLYNLKHNDSLELIRSNNGHDELYGDISVFMDKIHLTTVWLSNNKNVTGNIKSFANKPLASLYLENTNIDGDIADLLSSTSLINVRLSKTNVSGDIFSFRNNTNLSNLVSADCKYLYGEVEKLISYLCDNGRETGTLTLQMNDTYNVIFHGKSIGVVNVTFDASGATIKTSANVLLGTYNKSSKTWDYV